MNGHIITITDTYETPRKPSNYTDWYWKVHLQNAQIREYHRDLQNRHKNPIKTTTYFIKYQRSSICIYFKNYQREDDTLGRGLSHHVGLY